MGLLRQTLGQVNSGYPQTLIAKDNLSMGEYRQEQCHIDLLQGSLVIGKEPEIVLDDP